jgi:hypothetical protein
MLYRSFAVEDVVAVAVEAPGREAEGPEEAGLVLVDVAVEEVVAVVETEAVGVLTEVEVAVVEGRDDEAVAGMDEAVAGVAGAGGVRERGRGWQGVVAEATAATAEADGAGGAAVARR